MRSDTDVMPVGSFQLLHPDLLHTGRGPDEDVDPGRL